MFHAYYQQLKLPIDSFMCMELCTVHQYRPIENFHAYPHFIYIIARRDENKEEINSYYKMTYEDMEHITKDWLEEFLAPVVDAELYDTNTIGIPIVT
jgi:hypothetical protein